MTIKKGDIIKVKYEGRFPEGEIFDSTKKHGNEPMEFQVGTDMLVSGFENAVIGMKSGEEKEVTLKPEEAYGEPNPEYVQKIPKDKFPPEAKEGMMIGLPMPTGQQIPATIKEIGESEVTLDLNHPMAGKTLIFKIKVIEIKEGKLEEKNHDCECIEEECGPENSCCSEDKKDSCECC
ncbi:peptidylprolyl isomerase [archaeon]|jgi:peptidylprolyl isomerase|nr:peptidylprolyl isomerase [archaeon]